MIRELKTLVMVARAGSFAAAGHRIGLTQAAVSAQMQRLEAHLGVALFDRSGRSAVLNAMGQQVVQQAVALLERFDSLGTTPAETQGATRIVVGAITSIQRALLPEVLARFHVRHERCSTRIIPGVSLDLIQRVDAGDIDLAIIVRPPFALQAGLQATLLAREPFRLIVPRKLRGASWQTLLATQPFIRYDRTSFGGRLADRFLRRLHITPGDVCEVDEPDAIQALVAKGVGVALLPQTLGQKRWPPGVDAMDLGQETFHREIVAIRREDEAQAKAIEDLHALLLSIASNQKNVDGVE